MKILDGLGRGYEAIVTSEQRLAVMADTIAFLAVEANESNAFVATSGLLALTSSGESVLLYMQNTDPEKDIMIQLFDVSLGFASGTSTSGSHDVIYRAYAGPTGGTIISSGTQLTPGNLDIASRISPVGVFRGGGEGKTQTGGTLIATRILQAPSVFGLDLPVVIRRGSSICWSLQPPSGTTNMQATIQVFFANIETGEFAGPS